MNEIVVGDSRRTVKLARKDEGASQAIQAELDKGGNVHVEYSGGPVLCREPLYMRDKCILTLGKGVELKADYAAPGSPYQSFIDFDGVKDAEIEGDIGSGIFGFGWRDGSTEGLEGEWRHAINISDSTDVRLSGLNIEGPAGDCVYVGHHVDADGVWDSTQTNKQIMIHDCVLRNGYRQGITLATAEGFGMNECVIYGPKGTAPQACIDIEPGADSPITECNFTNLELRPVAGSAVLAVLERMSPSRVVDVIFANTYIKTENSARQASLRFKHGSSIGPSGSMIFIDLTVDNKAARVVDGVKFGDEDIPWMAGARYDVTFENSGFSINDSLTNRKVCRAFPDQGAEYAGRVSMIDCEAWCNSDQIFQSSREDTPFPIFGNIGYNGQTLVTKEEGSGGLYANPL